MIYDGPYIERLNVSKRLEPKVTSLKQVWVDQALEDERYLLKEVRTVENVSRFFLVLDSMTESAFLKKATDNFNYGCDHFSLK